MRNWSEKKLTDTYMELEAVRDAVGGAVDLLHGDFDKRFHKLLDIGQEFMLEWAKGQYNTAVQQFTVAYDEVCRRKSDSLRAMIERHPVTEFQREYVESEIKIKVGAELSATEQRIADLLSP